MYLETLPRTFGNPRQIFCHFNTLSAAVLLAIVLCKCLEKHLLGKVSVSFFSEDVDMAGLDVQCVLEESSTVACHCVLLAISCLQLRCFI